MRLADAHLAEAGQIELEGVLEILGEGPFLRDLGGAGVEDAENLLFDHAVAGWVGCRGGD